MSYYKIGNQIDPVLTYRTIEHIQREYSKNSLPWSLGFSGGKDSSALLKLVYIALENLKTRYKPVTVIFCDTGVEIPIVRSLVIETLNNISIEAIENDVPIKTHVVSPTLQDRYFSKVIGRGYPPPSYKFRWCTDVLRINPIRNFLNKMLGQSVILLGIRKGESMERDKVILRHKTNSEYYLQQANNKNVIIYSPIIEYKVHDVWSIITENSAPRSIDAEKLQILYSILTSDSSDNINSSDIFNAKGRLGCWTCTVVRQDKAVANLIREGYKSLEPLFEFRNWLVTIRNDSSYRCKFRRNGNIGLGPFTLAARKEILSKLLETQSKTRWNLINDEEIDYIQKQWAADSK